jgi:hypothetical protein
MLGEEGLLNLHQDRKAATNRSGSAVTRAFLAKGDAIAFLLF